MMKRGPDLVGSRGDEITPRGCSYLGILFLRKRSPQPPPRQDNFCKFIARDYCGMRQQTIGQRAGQNCDGADSNWEL